MLNKLIDKKVCIKFSNLEEQNEFMQLCRDNNVVNSFGNKVVISDYFYTYTAWRIVSKNDEIVLLPISLYAVCFYGYEIIHYSDFKCDLELSNENAMLSNTLSLPQVMEQIKEGEIYEQIQEQIFDAESKPMEITKNELGEIILLFNCNSKDFQGLYLNELLFKLKVQHKNFHEVVDINKRCLTNCRVEHWLIDTNMKCISEDITMIDLWDRFCKGEYLPLGVVLQVLGWMCTDSMAEIIKDGKWYLEGGN